MNPFIDTTRIPVIEGDDIFYIKWKMDFETKCRVRDTLTKMSLGASASGEIMFSVGAQELALAIHNIVAWSGPKFDGIACTPENIRRLDPDYPVFVKALEEITKRNTPQEKPDPNSTTTGATSSTESGTVPVVGTTSTSS